MYKINPFVFIFAILLLGFVASVASAQSRDNGAGNPSLLVGFYGGKNYSFPQISKQYKVISHLNSASATSPKTYTSTFNNQGSQFGFVMFYPIKGNLHLGFLPGYSSYTYNYKTQQKWESINGDVLEANNSFNQKLRYLEIPFLARYYLGTNKFKPYIQASFNYGILQSATKQTESKYIQTIELTDNEVQNTSLTSDYNDSYISSKLSVTAGAGISYDFDQLILTFGAAYDYNLNNLVDEKNRYDNSLFIGATNDVQDDITLNTLKFNFSVIFPISKITKSGGSIDCYYFKNGKKKKRKL